MKFLSKAKIQLVFYSLSHKGLQGEITCGLRQKELVCFPIGHACQKSSVFAGYFQGTITFPASSPVVVIAAAGGRILLYVTRKPEWKLLSDSRFSDLLQDWLPE